MIPTRIPVAIACALLTLAASSCRAPIEEQDAIRQLAADTRPVSSAEIAAFPESAGLAEFEQQFGRGEPQSGNRLAYRAAGDKAKFYWVYPYNPPTGAGPAIHHIVLADRLEEKGKVVWPEKYRKTPPATVAYIVSQMQP